MLRDSLAVHRIFGVVGPVLLLLLLLLLLLPPAYCSSRGRNFFSRSPEPFPGTYCFPVSSRFWSLSRIDSVVATCCFSFLCVPSKGVIREYESMRAWEYEGRHYGTMILWYCEILPLLWYDSMRHDTLIVWDYVWKRYWLYVAMICVFVCIWSSLVFSYCPASFSPFVLNLKAYLCVFCPSCCWNCIC